MLGFPQALLLWLLLLKRDSDTVCYKYGERLPSFILFLNISAVPGVSDGKARPGSEMPLCGTLTIFLMMHVRVRCVHNCVISL